MIYHTLILWKYRHVLRKTPWLGVILSKGSGASAFLALCARGEVGTRVPWPAVRFVFFFETAAVFLRSFFFFGGDDYFMSRCAIFFFGNLNENTNTKIYE